MSKNFDGIKKRKFDVEIDLSFYIVVHMILSQYIEKYILDYNFAQIATL